MKELKEKITKDIIKNGRQIEFKNMWLLYNFERLTDFFWTRKEAWAEAYRNNFDKEDTIEIYQVLRGDIKITLKYCSAKVGRSGNINCKTANPKNK